MASSLMGSTWDVPVSRASEHGNIKLSWYCNLDKDQEPWVQIPSQPLILPCNPEPVTKSHPNLSHRIEGICGDVAGAITM